MFFSLKSVVPAALFLAAKVEEQPRKLEHVIKVAHACLHPQETPLDTKSEVSVEIGELGSGVRSGGTRNGNGGSVLHPESRGYSISLNRVQQYPLSKRVAVS